MLGRIMSFDVGERRIGIAVSDLLGITAQGVETYHRTDNLEKDYDYLISLLKQYDVKELVVGLPKNMNNSLGFKADETKHFIDGLVKKYEISIKWIDERLTTMSAERMLIEADVSRKKRKNVIDKIAAVLILQTYLDRI